MTVSPRAHLMHLIAILAAAGTFATRATCYAELPWLVRFGRGALAITVVAGVYSRISRLGSSKTASQRAALPDLSQADPQFAALASHEVKTPLTGIKAYLELLADGDADDEATRAEFLNGIGSQVDRLERAVDGLFTAAVREECGEVFTTAISSIAGAKDRLSPSERQHLSAAGTTQPSHD